MRRPARHAAPPAPRPARPPRPRRRGRAAAAGAALVLVVLLAGVAFAGWYTLLRPVSDVAAGKPVTVDIPLGTTTEGIGILLADAGVVPSALMFRIEARDSADAANLLAGTYDLTTGMGYDAALAALAQGPDVVYYEVPVPEGFTVKQIARRFAERTGAREDELLGLMNDAPHFAPSHPYLAGAYRASLEGYLFPATYRVEKGTSAEAMVEMMLDRFDEEAAGLDWSYAKSRNLTFSEVVIVASVLEREAKLTEEYPLVASVIYNRLGKSMRLQLCATVLYEMDESKENLSIEDTKREGPYNTYIHDGLPPGPISNPGAKALAAAAHPPRTDYLYYVLTGADGSQTFTATYEEFLAAKAGAKR